MSRPQMSPGSNDLIPGLAGAVTFLILFFLHLTPLAVSILLAIGIYFGVKLLLPAPQAAEAPTQTFAEVLEDVRSLTQQMPSGSARVRLQNITDISESMARFGAAQPARAGDSLFVVQQYLESLRSGVRRYLD